MLKLDGFGNVQVHNSTFIANIGSDGGALEIESSLLVNITDCFFLYNLASESGGAIFASNEVALTISNSQFYYNAASRGGAISLALSAHLDISHSIF